MKRTEYREAGKVGSCENCSAWKDAGTRRGVWGARVALKLCAPECPPSALEKHGNSWSTRSWNGGHSRATELPTHTRPQPPRRIATVAPSATILHTATLRFSSPQGLRGACVSESVCADVPPNGTSRLPRIVVLTLAQVGGTRAPATSDPHAPPTPPDQSQDPKMWVTKRLVGPAHAIAHKPSTLDSPTLPHDCFDATAILRLR